MSAQISLVMTVYNRDRYLGEAIESVLAQTWQDFELVIWDDGSTDRSLEIAREYAKRDRRIRVVAAKHQGVSASLKAAFQQTTGSYIGCVDSDDLLAPTALAETVALLLANPKVGLVYTDYIDIDESGKVKGYGKRCIIPYSKDRLLLDFMTFHFQLIRRSVYDQVGGVDEAIAYVPDYDLCLKLSEVTEVQHLQKPLYYYRNHKVSICTQHQIAVAQNSVKAIAHAIERRGLAHLYQISLEILSYFPFNSIVKLALKRVATLALTTIPLTAAISLNPVHAQIAPASDGTGSIVQPNGNTFDITGGSQSSDGANLFHSFSQFGLNQNQTANFLSNPTIQNILGRVVGGDPSIINGLIQVTGGNSNLFLINPAGIIFGNNARLNIPADFTATTATSIGFGSSQFNAFGANNYAALVGTPSTFNFGISQPGSIVSAGQLTVGQGKNITLVGGAVVNTGNLTAPEGSIAIASVPGTSLVRISQPNHLLSLEIQPNQGSTFNPLSLPQLLTGAGASQATGLSVNSNGQVVLSSNTQVPVDTGTSIVSGTLDASSTNAGGSVYVLGNKVGLVDNARINASGDAGGGNVLVGGDYQGKGIVPNAAFSFVSENATINADALKDGNGGKIIIWSDQATRTYGTLTARGGAVSGNGGFIETSGKVYLDVTKPADASAPQGLPGTWLLDPSNVTIVPGMLGIGTLDPSTPNFTATADDSTVSADAISSALGSNNVVISTANPGGTQPGNIVQNSDANITKGPGISNTTLTLQAANSIVLNGSIAASSGNSVNVVLEGETGGSRTGDITINGTITTNGGFFTSRSINFNTTSSSGILTGGGFIDINATNNATINGAINTEGGNFTSNSGTFDSTNTSILTINGGDINISTSNTLSVGLLNSSSAGTGGEVNLTTIAGGIINIGGDINSSGFDGASGNITITGNSLLTQDAIFTTTEGSPQGNITFTGTLNGTSAGAKNLTLNAGTATITFGNAVGNSLPIGNLTVNSAGNTILNGNVTTSSNSTILFNSPVTLTNNATLTADEIEFTDLVSAGGFQIGLQPATISRGIQIGNAAPVAGNLNLTAAELALLTNYSSITIGRSDGSGAIAIAPTGVTFPAAVTIQSPNGAIAVNGAITGTGSGSVTLNGTTTLNANVTTADQNITINGNVSLANSNITLDTGAGGSGDITITGSINDTVAGAENLTLIAGTGNITFNGAIGNSTSLGNLNVNSGGVTTFTSNVNAANLTTDTSGTTILNGNIITNGVQNYGDNLIINSATSLISNNNNINFSGAVGSQTNLARDLTINAGLADITFSKAVGAGANQLGNIVIANARNITASEAIAATSLKQSAGTGTTTLNGTVTTTGAGGVDISTNGTISTTNINTNGGILKLTSSNGTINTTTGILNSSSTNSNGGDITLTALSNVSTGNIDSHSDVGRGGNISLTTQTTSVNTGNLNSTGAIAGGSITINAIDSITAKQINSSATIGQGGNVTLDPLNDIQVEFINAQGGTTGTGGNVDITTQRFFRATNTFSDRNNLTASISTAGGAGGGEIIIRHGGGGIIPFIVGNATTNGSAGVLTTAVETINSGSFLYTYIQGVPPSDIQIISVPEPPVITPTIPTPQTSLPSPPRESPPSQLPFVKDIPPLNIDSFTGEIEERFTNEFKQYSGISSDVPLTTQDEARDIVATIEEETGVKPALIYVAFVPQTLPPASPTKSLNPEPESDIIWQFRGQGFTISQVPPQPNSNSEKSALRDDDQLELVVVTAKGAPIRKRIEGATRQEVLKLAQEFRSQVVNIKRPRGYQTSGKQLYQWLIAPLEADLQARGINNLVFLMDTGLRSLPVAAIYDGQQFLVEKYSVGLMPSLSLTDTRYKDIKNSEVLAMGASQFSASTNLNPLPAVPAELSTIANQLWTGKSFLNEAFTLENLKAQRQKQPFGIVHLATHAEFKPGTPANSFIQLWDTKINLDELRQLGWSNPPVELVVLSACRTALGDDRAELGFAGFAILAGVKSALASLWYVSDEGTLALMTQFYEQLKVAPIKAEALQEAQVAMLKGETRIQDSKLRTSKGDFPLPSELQNISNRELKHPYYWAAFTMIGNPW